MSGTNIAWMFIAGMFFTYLIVVAVLDYLGKKRKAGL